MSVYVYLYVHTHTYIIVYSDQRRTLDLRGKDTKFDKIKLGGKERKRKYP